tara:strand:+ start:172 stop:435 length:264 start_codon:yes stop_codon:yes gene_type:complete
MAWLPGNGPGELVPGEGQFFLKKDPEWLVPGFFLVWSSSYLGGITSMKPLKTYPTSTGHTCYNWGATGTVSLDILMLSVEYLPKQHC